MTARRTIATVLAFVALNVATAMPHSTLRYVVWYPAFGYLSIEWLLRARAGYLRRRPHWTRASWRRYLAVCVVPAGALVIFAGMLAALEWKLPMVGGARSATREVWAWVSVVFMVIGAGGAATAVEMLSHGDPSRPFTWPRWLSREPRSLA